MKTLKVSKIAAIALALTLALAACGWFENDDNKNSATFTSTSDFSKWLDEKPDNTPDNPYRVKLNIKDRTSVDRYDLGLFRNSKKYVFLDFSGSTFTKLSSGVIAAFEGCNNLVGIILPNTVTSIERGGLGEGSFERCTNLTSVTLPTNPGFTSIVSSTFSGCTKLDGIIIPDSVTSIGSSAFYKTGLTSITIPNSVTSLSGFSNCTGLTEITIPNSVTTIGSYAFNETSLTSVTIPSSVTSIAIGAFHITSLTSVTFEGTIPKNDFKHADIFIGSESFLGNLRTTFYATDTDNGTPGTYTKSGNTWTLEQLEE